MVIVQSTYAKNGMSFDIVFINRSNMQLVKTYHIPSDDVLIFAALDANDLPSGDYIVKLKFAGTVGRCLYHLQKINQKTGRFFRPKLIKAGKTATWSYITLRDGDSIGFNPSFSL